MFKPIAVMVAESEMVKEFEGFSFDSMAQEAPAPPPQSQPEPQSEAHGKPSQTESGKYITHNSERPQF